VPPSSIDSAHWVMLSRGRSHNGLTLNQDGSLVAGQRRLAGFQLPADVPRIVVSPASPDRKYVLVGSTGTATSSLWVLGLTDGTAAPVTLPAPFVTFRAFDWSPSGQARGLLHSAQNRYWILPDTKQATKIDLALPRNVYVSRLSEPPAWSGDQVTLTAEGFCSRDDGMDKCVPAKERGRRYQVVLSTSRDQTRTRRVDVDTPPGAEEALNGFLGAIGHGDIDGALKFVSSDTSTRTDRDAARALKMFAPLLQVIAAKTSFSVPALTASPTYAQATVARTAPDFSRTPAGQRFSNDFTEWMFMAGLQSLAGQNSATEDAQLRTLIPIVQRFADGVRDIPAPSRTVTSICTLLPENGRWTVNPACGDLLPTR